MDKTICKEWEVNYRCNWCGAIIMNATKKQVNCEHCGHRIEEIHPPNSRKEKQWI